MNCQFPEKQSQRWEFFMQVIYEGKALLERKKKIFFFTPLASLASLIINFTEDRLIGGKQTRA